MKSTLYKLETTLICLITSLNLMAKPIDKETAENLMRADHSLKLKHLRDCGDVYVLKKDFSAEMGCDPSKNEVFVYSGFHHYPKKFKLSSLKMVSSAQPSYKTYAGKVFVHLSENIPQHMKNVDKVLDHYFASDLRERVAAKFAKEAGEIEKIQDEGLKNYIQITKKLLLEDMKDQPQNQIRTLLTLYPELINEIQAEEGSDLRPLLCRYELEKHRSALINKWSNVLIVLAMGMGLTFTAFNFFGYMMPALAVSAAVVAIAHGAKDVAFGVKDLKVAEKSANLALNIKKIQSQIRVNLARLESKRKMGPLTQEEDAAWEVLRDIKENFSRKRTKELDKINRDRHINRWQIARGTVVAGLAHMNLYGNPNFLVNLPRYILDFFQGYI